MESNFELAGTELNSNLKPLRLSDGVSFSFDANLHYTVQDDGYIYISSEHGGGYMEGRINDSIYWAVNAGSTTLFPVRKNDVLSLIRATGNIATSVYIKA